MARRNYWLCIRAVLRSYRHSEEDESSPGGKFRLQDLLIDYDTRQVFVGKEEIDLTQTEYNIMAFLSVHAGKVLTYAAIIRSVWGYSDYGSVKKLQVNMKNIRKKMGVTPVKSATSSTSLASDTVCWRRMRHSAAKVLRRLTGVVQHK